jgi:hypothetical protein
MTERISVWQVLKGRYNLEKTFQLSATQLNAGQKIPWDWDDKKIIELLETFQKIKDIDFEWKK